MNVRRLGIDGAWEFSPQQFPDARGKFAVWFDSEVFRQQLGFALDVKQTNHAVSRAGAVRGVHFASVPPGQGKYMYCPQGAVLDVVVDVRQGSPTFGRCESVSLSAENCTALYLAEGLGHAYVALEDNTVLTYLCTTLYNPAAEFSINALDPALALPWPEGLELILSDRDRAAPTLAEALAQGVLPSYEACLEFYKLKQASPH